MDEKTKIAASPRECPKCKYLNELKVKFCQSCGEALIKLPKIPATKPKDATSIIGSNSKSKPINKETSLVGSYKKPKPYKLIMLDHSKKIEEEYLLEEGKTIGREEVDIILNDASVSRKHCEITIDGEKIRIEDLKSKNGVFVRIRETSELQPGDEIRIGNKLFRVEEV
ncbi:MAG: FHA domain-containing protein [Leptospira sp.]|nr:FHA domain-containing protein [Leptospira sp.]